MRVEILRKQEVLTEPHVAEQSMESRIQKHPLGSVIRSLRSGDSQVGMGA